VEDDEIIIEKKARPLVDFAFTKTATTKTGTLELKGYASTFTVVDRDNEIVASDAFKNLDQYLRDNPILLWQHDQHKPIGQVKDASLDRSGLQVVAYMPQPEPEEEPWAHTAYHKVEKGIVRTFSVGGKFRKLVERGKAVKKIVGCELYEISVVSVPANPESLFEAAVKSVTGPLRPDLSPRAIAQMEQIVGMKAVTDPDLLEMTPAELTERYDELRSLYREAGKLAPDMGGWRELAAKQAALTSHEEILALTPEISEQVKLVQGEVAVKYGRTFSRRNEEAILTAARGIVEHGNALVNLLGKKDDDEVEEEETDEEPEPEKDGRKKDAPEAEAKDWGAGPTFNDRTAAITEALGRGFYVMDATETEALCSYWSDGPMTDESYTYVVAYSWNDGQVEVAPRNEWQRVEQRTEWVPKALAGLARLAALVADDDDKLGEA
jgi:HK97 family phage prohead protease